MGLIYQTVKLSGAKGEREVKALFDTGASHTFLQQTVAEAVAPLQALHRPLRFETATGIAEVVSAILADLWLEGHPIHWAFYVLPDLSEDLIIGTDFLQRWKIKLDLEREALILDPNALKLKLV